MSHFNLVFLATNPGAARQGKPSWAPRKTKVGAKENQAGRQGKPKKTKLSLGGFERFQTLAGDDRLEKSLAS